MCRGRARRPGPAGRRQCHAGHSGTQTAGDHAGDDEPPDAAASHGNHQAPPFATAAAERDWLVWVQPAQLAYRGTEAMLSACSELAPDVEAVLRSVRRPQDRVDALPGRGVHPVTVDDR